LRIFKGNLKQTFKSLLTKPSNINSLDLFSSSTNLKQIDEEEETKVAKGKGGVISTNIGYFSP